MSNPVIVSADRLAVNFINDLAAGRSNGNSPDVNLLSEHIGPHMIAILQVSASTHDVTAVKAEVQWRMEQDPIFRDAMLAQADPRKRTWTIPELLDRQFPKIPYIVPDLLPPGMTVVAGRPKVGKSLLAMQCAAAVGSGAVLFGQQVEQRPVLYYALEDSPMRIQDRLIRQRVPRYAQIEFRLDPPSVDRSGGNQLVKDLESGRHGLVIVDTSGRWMGGIDHQDYGETTQMLGPPQRAALEANASLLLVDHHRKSGGFEGGAIDDILGSTGKSAVADAALGLYRNSGKRGATLKIIGRDLDERELALDFDAETCTWKLLGDAGQVLADTLKGEILIAVRALADLGEVPTNKRIAEHLSRDPSNVNHAIHDLVIGGKLRKGPKTGRDQPYYIVDDHDYSFLQA